MKLVESNLYPVEYDFLAGGLKLIYETEKEFNCIVLDKAERKALLDILMEMQ